MFFLNHGLTIPLNLIQNLYENYLKLKNFYFFQTINTEKIEKNELTDLTNFQVLHEFLVLLLLFQIKLELFYLVSLYEYNDNTNFFFY